MSFLSNGKEYRDPIVFDRRDTAVPKIDLNKKVIDGRIYLDEIPAFANKVTISGMTEVQDSNTTLSETQYNVDYQLGIAYFNSSKNNTVVSPISYYGLGNTLIPIDRIYISPDSTEVSGGLIEKLKDLQLDLASIVSTSISTLIIAPYNAINKEKADLILTGTNDTLAINTALSNLNTLRGEGTQSMRIDFLGGDVKVEDTIIVPDNCKVYGNGVNLIPSGNTGWNYIKGVNNVDINDIVVGDVGGTSSGYGICIEGLGNITNCKVGDINGSINGSNNVGIEIMNGNVTNCTIGNIINKNKGISMTSGKVINCNIGKINNESIGVSSFFHGDVINCFIEEIANCSIGIKLLNNGNVINCKISKVIGIQENSAGSIGIMTHGTAEISNCTIGYISTWANGIRMRKLYEYDICKISNCTLGKVSDYSSGIDVVEADILNCIIGDVTGAVGTGDSALFSNGIYAQRANVIGCVIGDLNYANGIYVVNQVVTHTTKGKLYFVVMNNKIGIYVNNNTSNRAIKHDSNLYAYNNYFWGEFYPNGITISL